MSLSGTNHVLNVQEYEGQFNNSIMSLTSMMVKVNLAHMQRHPRACYVTGSLQALQINMQYQ